MTSIAFAARYSRYVLSALTSVAFGVIVHRIAFPN
jgi:hypothetical protein